MSGSVEIVVVRAGKWEMFNSYPSVDAAVEEGIGLKSQNAFPKVIVINHRKKSVEYFYDKNNGPKLDYASVQENLKKSSEMRMQAPKQRKKSAPKEAQKSEKKSSNPKSQKEKSPPPEKSAEEMARQRKAILILLGGIMVSIALLLITNFDPTGMLMSLTLVLLCGYYAYLMQTHEEDEMIEEMIESDTAPDVLGDNRLVEVNDVLTRIVKKAKTAYWDEDALKMKGDSHFGVLLYTVGAIHAYSNIDQKNLQLYIPALNQTIAGIGLDEASVLRCCQNIQEFRLNPRFAAMFESGFVNTQNVIKDPESRLGIARALEKWMGEETEEAQEEMRTSAVLFTDIVSFTEQTSQKGESWMTSVVLAHNQIVRDVLEGYGGREVKHTGDGMMAAFTSTSAAVSAAIHMQKGFKYFSENKQSLAFEVRVGICSGNPVQMDGDLFGNPVNMAARVMSLGEGLDITISESTYDICKEEGLNENFVAIPDIELKGFDGVHTVYKVNWQEPRPEEPSDEKDDEKNSQPSEGSNAPTDKTKDEEVKPEAEPKKETEEDTPPSA